MDQLEKLTKARIARGMREGAESRLREPHATEVHFDRETRCYTLTMLAGAKVSFYAHQVHELNGATLDQLADVSLSPSGGGISWEQIDMDIDMTGLVMDLVSGVGWRSAFRALLMREITTMTSPAKAAAARENGKKGGRPRKADKQDED